MNAPSGFWRRYAAYSLDTAIVAVLVSPLLWLRASAAWPAMAGTFSSLQMRLWELLDQAVANGGEPVAVLTDALSDPALRGGIATLAGQVTQLLIFATALLFVAAAAWFIPTESSRWQASPGKRAAGLRVTDTAGARCGTGRIVLRFVSGIASWLLLNLGHALAAWTRDKRALHDRLAGTRVELVDGASASMPRWARSWLLLQAALFFGFTSYVLFAYARLFVEAARGGLVG